MTPASQPTTVSRRGFALLGVLWVMIGVSLLSLGVSLIGREAVAAGQNRAGLARASWRAEDCIERARAAIAEALRSEAASRVRRTRRSAWAALDWAVAASPLVAEARCEVTMRPAGTAVDVNLADEEQLDALFRAAGVIAVGADSLTDALLDWRDTDDIPRPLGAERDWYARERRHLPRNGALADTRELFAYVRGFASLETGVLDSLLTVEPGRVLLDRAPPAVIASLPGLGDEALARLQESRLRGEPAVDVFALDARLSPHGSELLRSRYGDLARLTVTEPDAWILTSVGHSGISAATATIEVRLERAGDRAAVVRRRAW
jgi:general secretion pathway protein K